MYKSRLELYKKLIYFLKKRFSPGIAHEYRTFFAHIFYSDIISVSTKLNNDILRKHNKLLLDVGGARGEFCKVLKENYDLNCINVDADKKGIIFSPTVIAVGQNLPFKNETFNIILCRGLLEHAPLEMREQILAEIRRVLKKDGICRIVIPPWFNPHAGHQIKPFHILPFRLAVYLTRHIIRYDVKAKSLNDLELHPITFRHMSNLLKNIGFKIINCHDELLRNHFLTRIPIMREFMIPSVAFNVHKINNRMCAAINSKRARIRL